MSKTTATTIASVMLLFAQFGNGAVAAEEPLPNSARYNSWKSQHPNIEYPGVAPNGILFLIDSSNEMSETLRDRNTKLQATTSAVQAILNDPPPSVNLAVRTFSGETITPEGGAEGLIYGQAPRNVYTTTLIGIRNSNNATQIIKDLKALQPQGDGSLGTAFATAAMNEIHRLPSPIKVIVISSNSSKKFDVSSLLGEIPDGNVCIDVLSLGATNAAAERQLSQLATRTGGKFKRVTSRTELDEAIQKSVKQGQDLGAAAR